MSPSDFDSSPSLDSPWMVGLPKEESQLPPSQCPHLVALPQQLALPLLAVLELRVLDLRPRARLAPTELLPHCLLERLLDHPMVHP